MLAEVWRDCFEQVQTASERTDSEELSATAETASQSHTDASQQEPGDWTEQDPSETESQTDPAPTQGGSLQTAHQGAFQHPQTDLWQLADSLHRLSCMG